MASCDVSPYLRPCGLLIDTMLATRMKRSVRTEEFVPGGLGEEKDRKAMGGHLPVVL